MDNPSNPQLPLQSDVDIDVIDIDMPDGDWSDQWLDQIADAVVDQLLEFTRES